MLARDDKSALPLEASMIKVFDNAGLSVNAYLDPKVIIDPEQVYGAITGGYTHNVREKLKGFLQLASVAIQFSKVTEGRPYSIALRLREMGYVGELHAVGRINKEIMHFLIRVGFTHFHLPEPGEAIPEPIHSPFSFWYQTVGIGQVLVAIENCPKP